jgi:hypothetical protein
MVVVVAGTVVVGTIGFVVVDVGVVVVVVEGIGASSWPVVQAATRRSRPSTAGGRGIAPGYV